MAVSLIGLLTSLFAYLIAFPDPAKRRFDVYLALLSVHLLAAIAYWLYTYEFGQDAYMYYQDPYGFRHQPFATSTVFIAQSVQALRGLFGGSYLDYFLFFQAFGMVGVALLLRSFYETAEALAVELPRSTYLLVFLPGLHFWSVAIGKDAPMFMAVALATWASFRIQRRVFWFVLAAVIMYLIRPHIAAMAAGSALCVLLLNRGIPTAAKIILIAVGGVALAYLLQEAQATMGLKSLDPETISKFIERNQEFGAQFGSGANLQALPYPLKVLSLLFRPLFFDAGGKGAMALVASFENAVFLYIFGYISYHWRTLVRLMKPVYHIGFCLLFGAIVVMLLAAINYNIGLGQRQKMMAMPPFLVLYVTIFLYRRVNRAPLSAAGEGVQLHPAGAYPPPVRPRQGTLLPRPSSRVMFACAFPRIGSWGHGQGSCCPTNSEEQYALF